MTENKKNVPEVSLGQLLQALRDVASGKIEESEQPCEPSPKSKAFLDECVKEYEESRKRSAKSQKKKRAVCELVKSKER